MAFIRIKKVKGNTYAYLVKNTWKKQASSRQKVKKYLGRVIEITHNPRPFTQDISFRDFKESIRAAATWQARCFGFAPKGKILVKEDLLFYPTSLALTRQGKNVVIKTKEGYFCQHTLKQLFSFTLPEDEERSGMSLAQAFVEAGIQIPKETFIEIYHKL